MKNAKLTRSQMENHDPLAYSELEQRRVLAVGAFDDVTGMLSIKLQGEENIALGHNGSLVTINGNVDINPNVRGPQSVQISDLSHIEINGEGDKFIQKVFLQNDFSPGTDVELQTITIHDVDLVSISGNYETAGDVTFVASDLITNTKTASLNVGGNLDVSAKYVALGHRSLDQVNADSLTFNVLDQIFYHEDSDLRLVGKSTANSAWLVGIGSLTDDAFTSTNIVNNARLDADTIRVGDQVNDQFNSGSLRVFADSMASVNEDSSVLLIKSSDAKNLTITANGAISDFQADVIVHGRTELNGPMIELGEAGDSSFTTISLKFNSLGVVDIADQTATHIIESNTAGGLKLSSLGQITDSATSDITVTGDAEFVGTSIDLGVGTNVNFDGGLTFTANQQATFDVESGILLKGISSADSATLIAAGEIADHDVAATTIENALRMEAQSINVGDSGLDTFNIGSLNFSTTGDALITENSSLNLFGSSSANNIVLTSTGNLTDFNDAQIHALGNLSLAAERINLGTDIANIIQSSSLTFNSTVNTKIDMDSDVLFTGSNSALNFNMIAIGKIEDVFDARIEIGDTASFTGTDIELGELATDCLDVPGTLHVSASGLQNVVLGC